MLTVAEALSAIIAEVSRAAAVTVPLADALGLVLAEDAISDADSPPFDKALMDGFAVRAEDLVQANVTLRVIEEVMAGQMPQRTVGAGEATRIMTGAPLPQGANAVVPVEETELVAGNIDSVLIRTQGVKPGASILPRGAATRQGEQVLSIGRRLRAQEIGALAELGKGTVQVFRRPRVGILATGDELVPVDARPGPSQIRNSNEPMLAAQVAQAGCEPVPLGIARDQRVDLRRHIEAGLECDVLLLSGGVSAGKLDLVPSELASAGVRQVFHKVQIKPGKPIWFGVRERTSAVEKSPSPTGKLGKCYVFGLPGNPVSSMVCCELFVRTALRALLGIEHPEPVPIQARLTEEYQMQGNRPTYHPAYFTCDAGGYRVRAVDWLGSADLRATVDANAMVLFPPGDYTLPAGALIDVFPW